MYSTAHGCKLYKQVLVVGRERASDNYDTSSHMLMIVHSYYTSHAKLFTCTKGSNVNERSENSTTNLDLEGKIGIGSYNFPIEVRKEVMCRIRFVIFSSEVD